MMMVLSLIASGNAAAISAAGVKGPKTGVAIVDLARIVGRIRLAFGKMKPTLAAAGSFYSQKVHLSLSSIVHRSL